MLRLFLCLLLMAASTPTMVHAQRGGPSGEWELLGEGSVGFRTDNDAIQIRQSEQWFRDRSFRALRFAAERNDVHMDAITIHYINGHREQIGIDRMIRRGEALDVDLPGDRSFLKQIDMRYRANPKISFGLGGIKLDPAVVKVYGERAGRRPAPPPVLGLPPGWSEIDSGRASRGQDQIVLSKSGDRNLYRALRLRNLGGPVRIRGVRVTFGNGDVQPISLRVDLGPGQETEPFDLTGDARQIRDVTVELGRREGGPAELQLIGLKTRAPEDPFLGRGWELLGVQAVGPRAERDEITIRQSEDWYRERAFRRLHFVADRGSVQLMNIRITYFNGYSEGFAVDRLIEGNAEVAIDLRGDRKFIRSIAMYYRSVSGGRRAESIVKVYGELARR